MEWPVEKIIPNSQWWIWRPTFKVVCCKHFDRRKCWAPYEPTIKRACKPFVLLHIRSSTAIDYASLIIRLVIVIAAGQIGTVICVFFWISHADNFHRKETTLNFIVILILLFCELFSFLFDFFLRRHKWNLLKLAENGKWNFRLLKYLAGNLPNREQFIGFSK